MSAGKIIPSRFDVICGRGKQCTTHIGNQEFRRIIDSHLDEYAKANAKLDKSILVSTVFKTIRSKSPNGGFIRRNSSTGEFERVPDRVAREKVGQMFRDALQSQYRSSNESKRRHRAHKVTMQSHQASHFIRGNREITNILSQLRRQIRDDMEDVQAERLFDDANMAIISELKRSQLPPLDVSL